MQGSILAVVFGFTKVKCAENQLNYWLSPKKSSIKIKLMDLTKSKNELDKV